MALPVALDAMGGDRAPQEVVLGALRAARLGHELLLVGDEAYVRPLLGRRKLPLRHASQVVEMNDAATAPLRGKPGASIRVAMEEVAAGRACAAVSCGHSGAVMAAALHVLGRIPGATRPALVSVVPRADGGRAVLLDLGANVDCRPATLARFAVMGDAFARAVLGLDRPRVGLLSNGEERGKGNAQVREALPLLDALPLHFVGPVEPTGALRGAADVLVCDGFSGNVMLKTVEATADVVLALLRDDIARHPVERAAAWALRGALRRFRRRHSASAHGGALLLGVQGVVVVGHGRSDAGAVAAAVELARRAVEGDVVGCVTRALGE